jgi:hypothetical protein
VDRSGLIRTATNLEAILEVISKAFQLTACCRGRATVLIDRPARAGNLQKEH